MQPHIKGSDSTTSQQVPLPPQPGNISITKPLGEPQDSDLVCAIKHLLKVEKELFLPDFKFSTEEGPVCHNYKLLQQTKSNLEGLVKGPRRCVLNYGSKFKSTGELRKIIEKHPR